jgi:cell division protein FtsI (penicillin-binding protein 3)
LNEGLLRTRVFILAGILAVAFGAVVSRLVYLQVFRHTELSALAERQYSRTITLHAPRGPIVDRRGAPLATSSAAESLFAQPRAVGDPVRAAARLASILRMPERELHALLTSPKSFVWIKRQLPPALVDRVKSLREPGLGFIADPLRLYPNRELAAHIIGFEGEDGGLEGVERAREAGRSRDG